jgi:lipoprotein-anchoring transpeptidase ErfK/SrfK
MSVKREMGSRKTIVLRAMAAMVGLLLAACGSFIPTGPTQTPEPSGTSQLTKSQRLAVRWIEVLVDEQKVLFHDGDKIVGEYPVSTGVGTSPGTTTYPGDYRVRSMWRGPEETAPGIFVKDIVIFDWEHGNGFHSLPMDKDGNILDLTLGRPASAGCIRLANSDELYQFAETGMRVVIH